MKKNRFIKGCFFLLFLLAMPVALYGKNVFAVDITNEIRDKMLYQAVYKCYTHGHISSNFGPLKEYKLENLATGENSSLVMATGNDVSFKTCDSLFGYNNNIFTYFGTEVVKDNKEGINKVKTFLEKVGYNFVKKGEMTNTPTSDEYAQLKDSPTAGLDAVKYLSTGNKATVKDITSLDSIRIKNDELGKRLLYESYLKDYYGITLSSEKKSNNDKEISCYWAYGSVHTCYYNPDDVKKAADKGKVNGIGNSSGLFQANSLDIYGLIKEIGSLPTEATDKTSTEDSESENSDSIRELCEKSNLNGQGWALCPALENTTYTAGAIDMLIEESLSVDTELYNYDSDAYRIWEIMRILANIIMIIILMFIIFSQITGFGIDNYGIKKMMPKLIVAAVLINLSFSICMVAIDISNILGVGLRNLFGAIGQSLEVGQDNGAQNFIASTVALLLGMGTGASSVAPAIAAIGMLEMGPMLVIVVMLSLLGALAAILLFFAALCARTVLIILCLAVAPIAFALYVLPNTQNLFKKWFGAIKAVLVVFPICGALSGISTLIKGIARSSSDFVMLVIGLLAPFMVFFLLPSLLRNALSAVGQIGSAFQSLSQKISGGVQGARNAIQNSDLYKDSMSQATAKKAKNVRDKLTKRLEDGKKLSAYDYGRLRRSSRIAAINEVSLERMYEDAFRYESQDDVAKAFETSLAGQDTERTIAALSHLTKNGQTEAAYRVLEKSNLIGKDENFKKRFASALQSTGIDPMVGYGIYLSQPKGASDTEMSFRDYMKSHDGDGYVIGRLLSKGDQQMVGLSKDDLKLLNSNIGPNGQPDPDSIGLNAFDGLGPEDRAKLGRMIGVTLSQKLKDDHRGQLDKAIRDHHFKAGELNLNASQLPFLKFETIEALQGSYRGNPEEIKALIRQELATAIGNAASDQMIKSQMDSKVSEYLGVDANRGGGHP